MKDNTNVAEVVIKVNSKAAEDKLERLKSKSKLLNEELKKASDAGDQEAADKISKKVLRNNNAIRKMYSELQNIESALKSLDKASPRELERTIRSLSQAMNDGTVRRGTKEWDEYVLKLKTVKDQLRKVKDEMKPDKEDSIFDSLNNGFNKWGASIAAAAASFAVVIMSGKAAVQTYADMQAEEANVIKFTEMTTDEVKELNNAFKNIDTRTGRGELNKMAQDAGRLGKNSVKDVLGFVNAADKINVALDDLGNEATLKLSKLTGIFGDEALYGTEQSLLKVGSVINVLSQNCSASAPYIAEFTSRIGGIAAQSKMTISQVMAFAAVLDSQGLAVEASATAVGQLITAIYKEPAKIAKAAGMDVQKFSDLVKKDMNGALISLFEQLNKMGGMGNLASVFDEMGTDGARAVPVLSSLAQKIGMLKWEQQEANTAFREGISITKEFNVQNNTVQAKLDKNKKKFNEMAITLGEQLLPVMSQCISGSSMLMRVLSELVSFFIKYKTEIITVAAAVAAYNVILGIAAAKTKIAEVWTTAWTAAQTKLKSALAVVNVAVAALTNTFAYLTNGMKVTDSMQQRWAKATSALNFANVTGAIIALGAAVFYLYKKYKETLTIEKEMEEINKSVAEATAEQIAQVRSLKKVIDDETKSNLERYKAIKQLKEIIPEYNAELSKEGRIINENTAAIDKYIASIKKEARAKAVRDQLAKIQGEMLELEEENGAVSEKTVTHGNRSWKETVYGDKWSGKDKLKYYQLQTKFNKLAEIGGVESIPQMEKNVEHIEKVNDALLKTNAEYKKAYDELVKEYNRDWSSSEKASKPEKAQDDWNLRVYKLNEQFKDVRPEQSQQEPFTLGPTQKELDKAESEAEKRLKKAKEALKKDLDAEEVKHNTNLAYNTIAYTDGDQDYKQFLEAKEKEERDHLDRVAKIHEEHNLLDVVAYSDTLLKRAELDKKDQEKRKKEKTKESLEQTEKTHSDNVQGIENQFYDVDSVMFLNQQAMHQAMLQEDLRYLKEKKELYEEGSKERADIEKQIDQKLHEDQLENKKRTAEQLEQFQEQYGKMSGSKREKMELDILDNLHKQGLISEKEYNRAVAEVKDRYASQDRERTRKVQSEYADLVVNLYDSFNNFFKDIGKEGADFWANLSNLASSSFAILSTMLSQYSAYVSAERDVEIAQIEKRYEKEITAAGKNEKAKTRLEKQKEKEIAAVKNKYNQKAMKIELSAAVAQTAVAAINAYASASKVNWVLGAVAAAMATAAGMAQVAIIKKQHEAQAAGYYDGGFTSKDPNNRKEVGVVHANEFIANHKAVNNPELKPVLRLIDYAQKNNTVGSLTAKDVTRALGNPYPAYSMPPSGSSDVNGSSGSLDAVSVNEKAGNAISRLNELLENGIESFIVLDGERGFHNRYERFKKLNDNGKR